MVAWKKLTRTKRPLVQTISGTGTSTNRYGSANVDKGTIRVLVPKRAVFMCGPSHPLSLPDIGSQNPKLDQVFLFGGYHPYLPTIVKNEMFNFTFFADTFIFGSLDPSKPPTAQEPTWRHVITRGFPTPRCQSQVIIDPDTGKVFMFGGFTNLQFVPYSKKVDMGKSFGDIWQLRVDIDGGLFDTVDHKNEARTAKLGPRMRCFTCGEISIEWKKCGGQFSFALSECRALIVTAGTCEGKAFFCGSECLKVRRASASSLFHSM